jgi:hypothetical protein
MSFQKKYPVMSRRQLMSEFNISRKTLDFWTKEAGVTCQRRLLTPKFVEAIFDYAYGGSGGKPDTSPARL